jgi:hypothetical protein
MLTGMKHFVFELGLRTIRNSDTALHYMMVDGIRPYRIPSVLPLELLDGMVQLSGRPCNGERDYTANKISYENSVKMY